MWCVVVLTHMVFCHSDAHPSVGFVAIVHVFLMFLNYRFVVCGYGSVEYESGMALRNCISETSDLS